MGLKVSILRYVSQNSEIKSWEFEINSQNSEENVEILPHYLKVLMLHVQKQEKEIPTQTVFHFG